jgi:hypothetical protein
MQIDQRRIEDAIIAEVAANLTNEHEFASRLHKAIDERINVLFAKKANEQIETAINDAIRSGFDREYHRVTTFGEKSGDSTTIRKELDRLIGGYWNTQVNTQGKPDTGYGGKMTRAEWVMAQIVADDFNAQMKQHVVNVAGGLKDNLRKSLHETVNGLLSEVFKVKSQDDVTLQRTGDA